MVVLLLVKDFDIRAGRLLSRSAIDVFYKLNHTVLFNRDGVDVDITICKLARSIDSSRSTVTRAKKELLDKGFIAQSKTCNNKCIYTLKKMSYDLFVSALMECPTDEFLVNIFDSSLHENMELLSLFPIVHGVEEHSKEEEKVLVASVGHRLPKTVSRVGFVSSNSYKDDKIHPFVEWKKPIDKWNSIDFCDYFRIEYEQNLGTKCPSTRIAASTMARQIKRLGKEDLKKQIKIFFEFCKKADYAPTWETFASANVQQKLDYYRATGKIAGYEGKTKGQVKTQEEIEASRKKEEATLIVSDIFYLIHRYNKYGSSIFEDPEKSEEYKQLVEIAVERGYKLFKFVNVQEGALTEFLKSIGRYEEAVNYPTL